MNNIYTLLVKWKNIKRSCTYIGGFLYFFCMCNIALGLLTKVYVGFLSGGPFGMLYAGNPWLQTRHSSILLIAIFSVFLFVDFLRKDIELIKFWTDLDLRAKTILSNFVAKHERKIYINSPRLTELTVRCQGNVID